MRSNKRLPARFPDGTKYVLESVGGMVRRYVEFPDGRQIVLSSRKAVSSFCTDDHEVSIVPPVTEPLPVRKRAVARRSSRTLAHA